MTLNEIFRKEELTLLHNVLVDKILDERHWGHKSDTLELLYILKQVDESLNLVPCYSFDDVAYMYGRPIVEDVNF